MTAIATLRFIVSVTKNARFHFSANNFGSSTPFTNTILNIVQNNSRTFLTTAVSKNNESLSDSELDNVTYDRVCSETLNSLCDYFEELTENATNIKGSDVAYGDGVLTVNLGRDYGIYVINRQSPNKQIWLSSPTSGPKRYDFVGPKTAESGKWIYKHTGESMHALLQNEIKQILKQQPVDFLKLPYSK